MTILILLFPVFFVRSGNAESIHELAQHTHIHGISYNRDAGEAELLLATHHGMFAVLRDGGETDFFHTRFHGILS